MGHGRRTIVAAQPPPSKGNSRPNHALVTIRLFEPPETAILVGAPSLLCPCGSSHIVQGHLMSLCPLRPLC